ncbi:subunit 17 of mediator complex-domain-containing protein [Epithele typhae]|uniref:subunit 17 of mediator complex-domain-containing protein n=1 Tax=Epithele typhae TaxID=378194 RepID=UPI00200742FA|nr:subunit 17 of mediator complex-domain-containing protein [Epithele typhae]KAH9943450.1 subunit 17 of mediator complex-domain-containing protein [Epithele typhae]
MEDPPWKKLKLSLERPYKDDNGEPLLELLDITPDGQHIYLPREDPTAAVGTKFRRIFRERGLDYFDAEKGSRGAASAAELASAKDEELSKDEDAVEPSHHMTPEELFKMRGELMAQLYTAQGEMSQARDMLALLLASSPPAEQQSTLPPNPLAATQVTKPSPLASVQAFNAQLTIGGKDKSLRQAADLFKDAAEKMEQSRQSGEKYWMDALKIRRCNWGLIPAPLPLGSATGKGAEKTAKDFLISFGLEESPTTFRQRAIGRMSAFDADKAVEFPLRQRTRLRVSMTRTAQDGTRLTTYNRLLEPDNGSLDGALRAAQTEVVEQEIFAALIREASSLPTASAEVSERLIVIEAAQTTELRFELVDGDSLYVSNDNIDPQCDLVYSLLFVLLSRAHRISKSARLARSSIAPVAPTSPPPILQPIIDVLQYREFWERVRDEIDRVVDALRHAGVTTKVHYDPVADGGAALAQSFISEKPAPVSGSAILRIDGRHTLRFTMASPSTLVVHLPQATLPIASVTQLVQLLADEISSRLLNRICEIGTELCERVNGTWFVDLLSGRSVGRWQGCTL